MEVAVFVVPVGPRWAVRQALTGPDLSVHLLEIQAIAAAAGLAREVGGCVQIADQQGNLRRFERTVPRVQRSLIDASR